MTLRTFLNELNLSKEVVTRVSLLLDRIESGQSEIFKNPILDTYSDDLVLSGLDAIINSNRSKLNDTLYDIELVQRSKFGPRSIAKKWADRKEQLTDYYGDSELGIALRVKEPVLNRLTPISLDAAIGYLKNDTNSGLPLMVKKGNVKPGYSKLYLNELQQEYPALLFTRTQEDSKTRDVKGYPMSDTVNEMMFYRPLLGVQRRLPWRAALNTPDVVDDAITKLYNTARDANLDLLSIDFKSYDSSVKRGLQTAAFNYIKNCFQKKWHPNLDRIARRFNTIPLITPDGILYGPHGVPSGSTFTNEVDSIAQYLMAASCEDVKFLPLCQVQGDDGVYITSDAEKVKACFESYGVKVSEGAKTVISKEYVVYLQSLYHGDYARNGKLVGIYPLYRALSRIMYLERFDNFNKDGISGSDYFAIRTISILENCKHHPLFNEFVKYVMSLDKYGLNFSDQGYLRFVERTKYQEGKDITFGNWQYGDKISDMKSFRTYEIIKGVNV